jgi:threonine/homoserine/homoserine lactone efflux protein
VINWVGFVPAALLVSLIPGANQLLGLSNAVRHGTIAALAGIGGRLTAFIVLVGLVVTGLGATLAASTTALTVIKWVGVGYLAWLGISSLWQARQALSGAEAPPAAGGGGVWPLVGNEFAVAISNPKALLLFAALLPQFAGEPGPGADLRIALLGAAYLGIELLVGLGYITIGSRIGATGISARTRSRVDLGSGICFLGLAGLLAVEDVVSR